MAQVAGTHSFAGTTNAAGVREDLSDLIGMIDPDEVPLQSMIAGQTSATQVDHRWQTQSLATVSATNAQIQGDDIGTFDNVTASVLVNNRTQILRKTFIVADGLREADTAGRDDDVDFQKILKGMEIKRDLEASLLSVNQLVVGTSGTGARLRSLSNWISGSSTAPDTTHFAGAPSGQTTAVTGLDVSGGAITSASSGRAITLALVSGACQRSFQQGGNPRYLVVTPRYKVILSALQGGTSAGSANTRLNIDNKRSQAAIIAGADVFSSDFGALTIVPDRFCHGFTGSGLATAYVIDPRYVKIADFRPYQTTELAKTGDATKYMCLRETTLEVLAPTAHAKIADLDATL
jgi:hypothetical protein